MKNIVLSIAFFTLLVSATAQNDREKEFQIRVGVGFAGYGAANEMKYDLGSATVSSKDTSGAVARYVPIELRYEFHPRFNAGLDMKFGSYLYDPNEDNKGKSNRFSSIGIGLEGTIVSKNNFRWYGGLGFDVTRLEISEQHGSGALGYKETSVWSGGGVKMYSGILAYFGDGPLGFNTSFAFDSHSLDLLEVTRDDTNVDIDNLSGNLRIIGFHWNVGLVLRIR